MDLANEDVLIDEQELTIDGETGELLIETANWAKFIAVSFFIATGLIVICTVIYTRQIWIAYDSMGSFYGKDYITNFLLKIVAGIVLGVATVTVTYYFLLHFGIKVKAGVQTENIETVNKGLKSLKVHFILIGVLLILGILFQLYNIFK